MNILVPYSFPLKNGCRAGVLAAVTADAGAAATTTAD